MRVLILGGTMEALQLAERLAKRSDLVVTLSLAGRTTATRSSSATRGCGCGSGCVEEP